jgi:hypothetical protein
MGYEQAFFYYYGLVTQYLTVKCLKIRGKDHLFLTESNPSEYAKYDLEVVRSKMVICSIRTHWTHDE